MTNPIRAIADFRLNGALLAAAMMAGLSTGISHAGLIPYDTEEVRELISQVVKTGDLNTMSALIREGLDINLLDADGEPALVTAVVAGQDDMVHLLLAHDADVMARTQKGMTALHAAAYVGNLAIARTLVAHGAAVNDQANIASITPLHAASEENQFRVVKLLVSAGADVQRVEANGYTAGSRAGWREHWDVVRYLLAAGDTCQPEELAGAWLRDKCTHLDLDTSN